MNEPPGDPPDSDIYDFAPEAPTPPKPARPVPPQGSESPTAPKLAYRSARDARPAKDDPETLMNLHAPLWLLVGGVLVEIIGAFFFHRNYRAAVIGLGIQVVFRTLIMIIGILM